MIAVRISPSCHKRWRTRTERGSDGVVKNKLLRLPHSPLLNHNPNLSVHKGEFFGSPWAEGDLWEVGVEELGMGRGDFFVDLFDIFGH